MSLQARRTMARFVLSRGLSRRRAAWLCSTPRSGMDYKSGRERRDRWLSAALRIVAREDSSWGYRLAGGYLRLRGWQLNNKRVYMSLQSAEVSRDSLPWPNANVPFGSLAALQDSTIPTAAIGCKADITPILLTDALRPQWGPIQRGAGGQKLVFE